MKNGLVLILKLIIILIAIAVIASMIRFPLTEGRAANLDLISIYADPLIIYTYFASIPFFVGLFQAFKLLGYVRAKNVKSTIKALKKIKIASISLIGLIIIALIWIRFFAHGEDAAGPTMLGFLASLTFAATAYAAFYFQKRLA